MHYHARETERRINLRAEKQTLYGTDGRTRTDTPKEPDFESGASTNSATPAYQEMRLYKTERFKKLQLISQNFAFFTDYPFLHITE